MGYERTLNMEINKELDALQEQGRPWMAHWVTHSIVLRHEDEFNGEARFARHNSYANVRDQVRRQINNRAGDKTEQDDNQPRLSGYHHLQQYYVVKRKGKDVGIPIHTMTDREIDEKITRYESMSVACRDHADELRGFKRQRAAERRNRRKAA